MQFALRMLIVLSLTPAHAVANPVNCRALHASTEISWASIAGDDSTTCVASVDSAEVFRVAFTQYPDAADLEATGNEVGEAAGVDVTWSIYGYDFLARRAVLPISWEGHEPPIRMVVSVPKLSSIQLLERTLMFVSQLRPPPIDQWSN